MRSEEEVKAAIAVLGATFIGGEMRHFVWGSVDEERGRAWAMFQVLGWVAGAPDSDFTTTLEFVARKIAQYTERKLREGKHANIA